MRILRESSMPPASTVTATIGFFDGVHRGHRFLLSQVAAQARIRGEKAMAVTFARHPAEILNPGTVKPLLTTFNERCALLEEAGMDYCAVLDFTPELSRLSARDFMKEYLRERFHVGMLVMGYDHSFGHDKDEDFNDYCREGEQLGLKIIRAEKYMVPGDIKVSSTQVRKQLLAGNVDTAAKMLGRFYSLKDTIVEGHHVGKSLGFPTANINVASTRKIIPASGVYAAWANIGGAEYASVVNIGTRPTLRNGDDTSVEAYIMGFDGNIYGHELEIKFVSRLREEKRFASLDGLRAQISRDIQDAKNILNNKQSGVNVKVQDKKTT